MCEKLHRGKNKSEELVRKRQWSPRVACLFMFGGENFEMGRLKVGKDQQRKGKGIKQKALTWHRMRRHEMDPIKGQIPMKETKDYLKPTPCLYS
jgi:hypothetical protein